MRSTLSQFCDKIIEAAILATVLLIPLFFNFYSARIFEGEKAGLLRAMAFILAAAGLIRAAEDWGRGRPSTFARLRGQPLASVAVLYGIVIGLASLTSITPRLSLWGSYQRVQGLVTALAYLVLFFATLTTFRTAHQQERLILVALMASIPVALFGIWQNFGFDPIPWTSENPSRVFSTLDNPIFLGAYLMMLAPLTLVQIARCWMARKGLDFRWQGAGLQLRRPFSSLSLVSYGMLLALQIAALVFTRSRGPLLGLVTGVGFVALLLALFAGRRRMAGGLVTLAVIGVLFLTLFNLPNTPLAPLHNVPYIGRFGRIFGRASAQVRTLIWQSTIDRFAETPSRLVFGYGPESTHAVLLRTYQPELRRREPGRLPDRAHNVVFETLITTGMAGVLVTLALFATTFYLGLRRLNLIGSQRERNWWLSWLIAGLILGALLPRLIRGTWIYSGVGAGLGFVAGLSTYVIGRLMRPGRTQQSALDGRTLLLTGLLAALLAHFVEINFGIRVTATQSLFWVMAGLVGVLYASAAESQPLPDTAKACPELRRRAVEPATITLAWDAERGARALLAGLMLSTLIFSFFLFGESASAISKPSVWLLLLVSWVLAGLLLVVDPSRPASAPGTAWIYPVLSLTWAALFLLIRTLVLALGGDALALLTLYAVWLLLSSVIIAMLLPRPAPPAAFWRGAIGLVYPLPALVALILIGQVVLRPLQADIYLQSAVANAAAGRWPEALGLYRGAVTRAPAVDVYQQRLGEAYAMVAERVADPVQRAVLFEAGRQAFEQALTLNPAEPIHRFNLAHLYLLWARDTEDAGQRGVLLNQAAILYQQTATVMPTDPQVLDEWGLVLLAQGDPENALDKYRAALRLDPDHAQTYLQMGGLYQQLGKLDDALLAYQRAVELAPKLVEAHRALADLYHQQGRLEEAVAAQEQAAALQPTDYAIHQNLALLYYDLGRIDRAIAEARLALTYAPPDRQAALQNLVQSLQAQRNP